MLATSGETLFARYAFPPNHLGHCGPPGSAVLLTAGASGSEAGELRQRAPKFDGAWPYLQLLAAAAGGVDPLESSVVSSYWLGGDLVDQVDRRSFDASVRSAFGGQPGVIERLDRSGVLGVGPTHAFHVFVVYPWIGLLGTGGDVPRSILDTCRVRWGVVESADQDMASVRYRPLTWDGNALGLGAEEHGTFRWQRDGQSFVDDLEPGDQVAMHWDWVCERLDDAQVIELARTTAQQIIQSNSWLAEREPVGAARASRHA
jgi:hypothetical protein